MGKMKTFKDKDSEKHYKDKNKEFYQRINKLFTENDIPLSSVVQNHPCFSQRRTFPKVLANYELFKIVQNIPGSFLELGVFLGAGLFSWSHLLETFCPLDRSRKVFGFDHFEGYKDFSENDVNLEDYFKNNLDGDRMTSSYEITSELVDIHEQDGIFPGVPRTEVIMGDISTTIPKFISEHAGIRFSLIYFDINLYEPIKTSLENLYDLLLPGGVIAFTGYSTEPWQGEAKAVNEFFEANSLQIPKMRKFPWSNLPKAYFIKT